MEATAAKTLLQKRDERIALRLPKALKLAIEREAKQAGLGVSDYIILQLALALKGDKS